ncbi:MAG: hypothetical protein D6686_03155 [Alphaproteobacteria bacterium]|nr:MAG: hypothetical protein D6686_03155 [Alphaproteobacteria bacterium]
MGAAALLAGCGGDIATPGGIGTDLRRIAVMRVETRVSQNADIYYPDASGQVAAEAARRSTPDDPVYLTAREREGRVRAQIAAEVNAAVIDALRGMPAGDLPVVLEVLVTRYRIRSLLRGALLGSDHLAEATITLRDARTGAPVSEPLAVSAESTEQVAILGGLQLRAIRPAPARRLNRNLAAEIRAALDRVTG